jgi:hypothetical protein
MRDELKPKSDELDVVLDAALSTYANPEPSLGLTARILAAARAAAPLRQFRWIIWAIPAMAALLAVLILLPGRRIHRDPLPSTVQLSRSASTSPVTAPKLPIQASSARQASRLRATATVRAPIPALEPLPKQEVFPTPTPLSTEEQALVAAVNRNPEGVARQIGQSAAQSPEQPIEPLHIAEIHIPPLNPPDNNN